MPLLVVLSLLTVSYADYAKSFYPTCWVVRRRSVLNLFQIDSIPRSRTLKSFKLKAKNLIEGVKMRMRTFLAYTHLLNFLIGIFATSYILNVFWSFLEMWQMALYVYYLVLGFCGVAIACWIAMDGKHVERCAVEIQDLERRILDLERRIDHIKKSTLEKS